MSRTAKVFLACALGAFVGALVALEVNRWLWWLGMIAGGLAGYLAYDFRRVVEAVPTAWQAATSWRPDWERCRDALKDGWYMAVIISSAVPALSMLGLGLSSAMGLHHVLFMTLLFITTILWGVAMVVVTIFFGGIEESPERRAEFLEKLRRIAIRFNPITLYFWHLPRLLVIGVWKMLQGLWWLFVRTPDGLRVVRTFVWALFRTIHSDERLLCAVDAAIGAGVGYYFGNAVIGALAGGLVGVANYEILSKGVLKLIPTKS